MTHVSRLYFAGLLLFLSTALISPVHATSYTLKDPIKAKGQSGFCIECHKDATPGIFSQWSQSAHARNNPEVGCADCHVSGKGEPDAFLHADKFYIRTIVTPFVCGKCHKDEMRDYFTSGHAQALEVLKKIDENDPRYPIVSRYKDDNFAQCAGCHGSEVKFAPENRPDPSTWPNSGAGRINPNKSHGNCATCHMGHSFSVAAARQPETCLRCHDGANYPEGDIYRHSPHGVLYETQTDKSVLNLNGYYLDGREISSPTCAFCHFNGSGMGLLTRHNPAWRLPRDLTFVEAPLAARSENLRGNMKSVCVQCHAAPVIDRFFDNADSKLDEYQQNIVLPQLKDYQQKLKQAAGKEKEELLDAYSVFLAETKSFRMNLYMGSHGRQQR